MDINQKTAIYQQALDRYGNEAQMTMVFEETGELQNALAKYIRGRASKEDVITELADVSVMVEQMALLFGQEEFETEKERKINRLAERLCVSTTRDIQHPDQCMFYDRETYICSKCNMQCWLDVTGYKCDDYTTKTNDKI